MLAGELRQPDVLVVRLLVGDVLADALLAAAVEVEDGRAAGEVPQRQDVRLELDPLDRERQILGLSHRAA